ANPKLKNDAAPATYTATAAPPAPFSGAIGAMSCLMRRSSPPSARPVALLAAMSTKINAACSADFAQRNRERRRSACINRPDWLMELPQSLLAPVLIEQLG